MNNKWKRSESASNIPRLLRNYQIVSPCESMSRSPSPVKYGGNSKIPTPQCRDSKLNLSNQDIFGSHSKVNEDDFDFGDRNNNDMLNNKLDLKSGFGQELEEIEFEDPFEDISIEKAVSPPATKVQPKGNFNGKISELLPLQPLSFAQEHGSKKELVKPESIESLLSEHFIPDTTGWEDSIPISKSNFLEDKKSGSQINIPISKSNDKKQKDSFQSASFTKIKSKSQDTQPVKTNALYITSGLITKVGKNLDLKQITDLNLSLSRSWNRKIQFIENLDGLSNLQTLNLSNNNIYKIQNLTPLVNLISINLSSNQISSFNGLDVLPKLQHINLNDNKISSFPKWIGKKLTMLNSLKVAYNDISQLAEMKKLSSLTNLSELDYLGNMIADLPHHESMVIFNVKTLEILNGAHIDQAKRQDAVRRYEQVEIDQLESQLTKLQMEVAKLQKNNEQLLHDYKNSEAREKTLNDKLNELKKSLRSNHEEVQAQRDLNESKSKELSRLCEKQFKLEQELAFYKLDAKFDEFWIPSHAQTNDADNNNTESPYIGKAIYKKSVKENQSIVLDEEQSKRFVGFLRRLDMEKIKSNTPVVDCFHNIFDSLDISKKNNEDEIKNLTNILKDTKDQMSHYKSLFKETKGLLQEKEKQQDRINKDFNNNMIATQQLHKEMEQLKLNFGKLSSDYDKCLCFLKCLLQYFSNNVEGINDIEKMHDKAMQAVLSNLKNYIIDTKSYAYSLKNYMKKYSDEKEDLVATINQLQNEINKTRNTITKLKNEIDQKDSNERVLNHQLAIMKSSRHKDNKDVSLSEYDAICEEMKHRILHLNRKIQKLKDQNKAQRHALEKETDEKLQFANTLEESKKHYDEHCLHMNKEMNRLNQINEDLLLESQELKKSKASSHDHVDEMRKQAQFILDQEVDRMNEILSYLHSDLLSIKQLLNNFKQDHEKKVKNMESFSNSAIQMFLNLENQVQDLKKGNSNNEDRLLKEILDIQKALRKVIQDTKGNEFSAELYDNVMQFIDALETEIEKSKNQSNIEENNIDSLLDSFEQLNLIKQKLDKADNFVNNGNDVNNEIDENTIKRVFSQIGKLEMKLSSLTDQEQQQFMGNNLQNSVHKDVRNLHEYPREVQQTSPETFDRHQNNSFERKAATKTFHRHYFDTNQHDSQDINNTNPVLFCNIKEHSIFNLKESNTITSPENEKFKQFDQSREDLRWELCRLENKVGNAVLQRSMLRHSTRLFEKSLIESNFVN